jgi:hypothetical protein
MTITHSSLRQCEVVIDNGLQNWKWTGGLLEPDSNHSENEATLCGTLSLDSGRYMDLTNRHPFP